MINQLNRCARLPAGEIPFALLCCELPAAPRVTSPVSPDSSLHFWWLYPFVHCPYTFFVATGSFVDIERPEAFALRVQQNFTVFSRQVIC